MCFCKCCNSASKDRQNSYESCIYSCNRDKDSPLSGCSLCFRLKIICNLGCTCCNCCGFCSLPCNFVCSPIISRFTCCKRPTLMDAPETLSMTDSYDSRYGAVDDVDETSRDRHLVSHIRKIMFDQNIYTVDGDDQVSQSSCSCC